ncbi:hypothetical protein AB832_08120 [Flavobacteriaceae bacterium (ex Bugula neritina AB1)]|nr:hypothetical protein AB832_08120 [Flavobacteriaceae bacterium (ex Bugula neritina AB1)]
MLTKNKRLDKIQPLLRSMHGQLEHSVYGIVDSVTNGVPNVVRRWRGTIGNMVATDEEPNIFVIEKLEPMILKHKKYKCMFGGRAGSKSIMAMDVMAGEVNSNGSKVFCLRERMTSLRESIYEGIKERVRDQSFKGFAPYPSLWEIRHNTGGKFKFGGLQNIIDMKGSFNYKFFLTEEAARVSQKTLDTLGATLRGVEGAELWYIWNPESSTDAMSQEFIAPYQADLDRYGYYEDDYHLIINVNFNDNPWFFEDESLREEYEKDKEKMIDGRLSRSRFNHIWHGAFNDDIDTSVILPDWFDACIDAHIKLGFEPRGAKVVGHDPSDTGLDEKGYCARHGVLIEELTELDGENANRAFDVACKKARQYGVDSFGWDCDGMGALLRDQAKRNFHGTKVNYFQYKGSESPHNPEAVFLYNDEYNIQKGAKVKDVFKNKKAQNIINFAERMRKTYEAVTKKGDVYIDPDEMVSFSSKIDKVMLAKFRAECCKTPLKPSDKIMFFSKDELRRGVTTGNGDKIKIPSPNLFDAAVLSFDDDCIVKKQPGKAYIPRPIKPMGRR